MTGWRCIRITLKHELCCENMDHVEVAPIPYTSDMNLY